VAPVQVHPAQDIRARLDHAPLHRPDAGAPGFLEHLRERAAAIRGTFERAQFDALQDTAGHEA
jgi:hypothetical protein